MPKKRWIDYDPDSRVLSVYIHHSTLHGKDYQNHDLRVLECMRLMDFSPLKAPRY